MNNIAKYKKKKNTKTYIIIPFIISVVLYMLHNEKYAYISIAFGLILILLEISKSFSKKLEFSKMDLSDLDLLPGIEFENYIHQYFQEKGYKVTQTQDSCDFGADLIIEKENRKTAVQVKRYKNKLGVAAIQQAYGAAAFYDCDSSMVITNTYFSSAAKKLAEKTKTILVDRNQLVKSK